MIYLVAVMIDDADTNVGVYIGRSLCADHGALWERGRNVEHRCSQVARGMVGELGDLDFQWKRPKVYSLPAGNNKRDKTEIICTRAGMDGVISTPRGGCFDSRLTWKEHIHKKNH